MANATVERTRHSGAKDAKPSDRREEREPGFGEASSEPGDKRAEGVQADLSPNERELLHELIQSLRTIRYGSITLVIHDGRIVEVNKTVRIRRSRTARSEIEE